MLLVTYNRPKILRRVLRAYEKYLHYPGRLIWRLADDGSPEGYLDDISEEFERLNLRWTVTERLGLGANMNAGLKVAFEETDYVFLSEDDWLVLDYLDLAEAVCLMECVPEIGTVSYDEAGYSMRLDARALLVGGDKGWKVRYFVIHRDSRFRYSGGHPHLVHRRFHDACGYYAEGVQLGHVETNFRVRMQAVDLEVAILPEYVGWPKYKHIGWPTWKATEEDAGLMIQTGGKSEAGDSGV